MRKNRGIGLILLFVCYIQGMAQKMDMGSLSMMHGENSAYDVFFKWGLIMSRAGEASFTYNPDRTFTDAESLYLLLFKTTKFYDSFFKMRDTLSGYYNDDNMLIYSVKRTDEGNYYTIDELKFNYGNEQTSVHSVRYTPSGKKIDTTLITVGNACDMLSVAYYMRSVDRKKLTHGDTFPFTVAIGRDLVKMQFIYQNQAIVEHGKVKFNTLYFKIDIMDEEAFESTKTSAEVWIGNDDNFLPIKLRSKLKIGYVEVYFKTATGLAYPLSCRIEMK